MYSNGNDISIFKDLILNPNNPVFYSLAITIIIFAIVFIFFKYVIYPMNKKHILEKQELELKQVRLLALFADLDPDPVIRINGKGELLYLNEAAKLQKDFNELDKENLLQLLPELKKNLSSWIENNELVIQESYFKGKYYLISIRGNSNMGIAQIYFHNISKRKKFEDKLKVTSKRLKKLSIHLNNKLEEERNRIARELHDGIGQNMLFVKLKMQKYLDSKSNEIASEEAKIIENLYDGTIKDLKRVIYDLKPKILDEVGLEPALNYLCKSVSLESGIDGTIDVIGLKERLNPKLEIYIYRIIQEAINNIIKHSQAKNFNIQLIESPSVIRIMVSDDGIGFNIKSIENRSNGKIGYGLFNLKERVENLGGETKIDSTLNNGTILYIQLPKVNEHDKRTRHFNNIS